MIWELKSWMGMILGGGDTPDCPQQTPKQTPLLAPAVFPGVSPAVPPGGSPGVSPRLSPGESPQGVPWGSLRVSPEDPGGYLGGPWGYPEGWNNY